MYFRSITPNLIRYRACKTARRGEQRGREMAVAEAEASVPTYVQLRDQLRQEIISGRIPAGSRLTVAELVQRYGVSQMPVREALQWLQGEGLVTVLPHRGARVVSLDARFVRNIYDVCGVVEGLLARLSVRNITISDLSSLEDMHLRMSEAIERGATEDVNSLNTQFHQTIYQYSDNPEGLEIWERYSGLLATMRKEYGASNQRRKDMVSQHRAILDAIRTLDEDGIERLVRLHSQEAKQDLLERMGQTKAVHGGREWKGNASR